MDNRLYFVLAKGKMVCKNLEIEEGGVTLLLLHRFSTNKDIIVFPK